MTLCVRVFPMILVGLLTACGTGWGQTKDKAAGDKKLPQAQVLDGTPVKRAPAVNDDSIVRLASKPARDRLTTEAAQPGAAPADDTEKKAAAIASLEKQIAEKQKKIVLLMQLFVNDEQGFLRDPGGKQLDPEVKERRQAEQNELHEETGQLAQLKARLNALTAAR